jgi:adenine nucleotide transporter 17
MSSYNGLKSALLKKLHALDPTKYPAGSNVITPVQNLLLSCAAGIINVYVSAPLWVANMRLKSKDHAKYSGVWDCMIQIIKSEGLLSLWNGTLASLILVSNPVIHYVSYERMKTAIQLRRQQAGVANPFAFSAMEIFVLGALAKSLTTVVTYPLQVAQSLMRVQQKKQAPSATDKPNDGILACLTQIYKEDGVSGLFAGLEAKLLQTVLTAAISLVTYEKLLAIILLLLKPQPKAILEKAQA